MRFTEALKLAEEGRRIAFGHEGRPMCVVVMGGVKQLRYVDDNCPVTLSSRAFFDDNWREHVEGHDFAWARKQLEAGRVVENQEFPGQRWAGHLEIAYGFTFAHLDSKRWVLAKEQPATAESEEG